MAALTTFVPRLGGPRCDANVTWTSTGGLAENGRRGYTGAVRKFNYGDSIPLEAERAVKTTIGRCECIGRGFRAARIQGLLLLTPRSLSSLRGTDIPFSQTDGPRSVCFEETEIATKSLRELRVDSRVS